MVLVLFLSTVKEPFLWLLVGRTSPLLVPCYRLGCQVDLPLEHLAVGMLLLIEEFLDDRYAFFHLVALLYRLRLLKLLIKDSHHVDGVTQVAKAICHRSSPSHCLYLISHFLLYSIIISYSTNMDTSIVGERRSILDFTSNFNTVFVHLLISSK